MDESTTVTVLANRVNTLERELKKLRQTLADRQMPDLSHVTWDGAGVPPAAIAQVLGAAIIREMKKVTLAKGDLLWVSVPEGTSKKQYDGFRQAFRTCIPADVGVVVVSEKVGFGVVAEAYRVEAEMAEEARKAVEVAEVQAAAQKAVIEATPKRWEQPIRPFAKEMFVDPDDLDHRVLQTLDKLAESPGMEIRYQSVVEGVLYDSPNANAQLIGEAVDRLSAAGRVAVSVGAAERIQNTRLALTERGSNRLTRLNMTRGL